MTPLAEKYRSILNTLRSRIILLRIKCRRVLRLFVLPGFRGMPLYDVLVFFVRNCFKGRLTDRAAAVAFNFFLALFPLILFVFTLIPYLPFPDLKAQVLEQISNFLPAGTFDWVYDTIESIMHQPHSGLMSASILMAFVFGSSGISAIFDGFKNVYMDLDTFSWVKQRFHALCVLFIIGILILLSIAFISFGRTAITAVLRVVGVERIIVFHALNFFRWLVTVAFVMCSISLLYFFGNADKSRYHFFSPGSLLATVLFIMATVGFDIYISNFSKYNALYGSIGTLIILMMWIWIVAIVILCGNDLNSTILSLARADSTSQNES